jgi:hypothetical protein
MRLPVKRRKKSEMHYVWLYDIYRKRNSEKTCDDAGEHG